LRTALPAACLSRHGGHHWRLPISPPVAPWSGWVMHCAGEEIEPDGTAMLVYVIEAPKHA
jgi:hypothetical protein